MSGENIELGQLIKNKKEEKSLSDLTKKKGGNNIRNKRNNQRERGGQRGNLRRNNNLNRGNNRGNLRNSNRPQQQGRNQRGTLNNRRDSQFRRPLPPRKNIDRERERGGDRVRRRVPERRVQNRKDSDSTPQEKKYFQTNTIEIHNLAPTIIEEELRNLMTKYGAIEALKIERDIRGRSQETALIQYKEAVDCEVAKKELQGNILEERKLDIVIKSQDKPKYEQRFERNPRPDGIRRRNGFKRREQAQHKYHLKKSKQINMTTKPDTNIQQQQKQQLLPQIQQNIDIDNNNQNQSNPQQVNQQQNTQQQGLSPDQQTLKKLQKRRSSVEDKQDLGKVLGHAKKERKQIELEAQALANRIALLKQEELKSWKKISDTKKKTDDIFYLKKNQEKQQQQKEEYYKQKQNELENQRQYGYQQQLQSKQKRENIRNLILQQRHNDYVQIKQQQQLNQTRKKEYNNLKNGQNNYKTNQVKHNLLVGQKKIVKEKQKFLKKVRSEYKLEINLEQGYKQKKEQEIEEMEKLELELIKKLHNTQLIQKQAFEELENCLNLKASEYESQYKKKNQAFSQRKSKSSFNSNPTLLESQRNIFSQNTPRQKPSLPQLQIQQNQQKLSKIQQFSKSNLQTPNSNNNLNNQNGQILHQQAKNGKENEQLEKQSLNKELVNNENDNQNQQQNLNGGAKQVEQKKDQKLPPVSKQNQIQKTINNKNNNNNLDNEKESSNDTSLWQAIRQNKIRSLKDLFLHKKLDIDEEIIDFTGHNLIHQAIVLNKFELFQLALDFHADINKPDVIGVTPLIRAVSLNRLKMAKKLLEMGADPDYKLNNVSALERAEFYENEQLYNELLQYSKQSQQSHNEIDDE
ncbi:Ankyrin repeat-containing domain [Pseudocohnilembus persalinus]|uniref:Ankyrin repeat-containing domain n=1 Tax=Pseudocohnilembus persalinus TaxID=266149 RepID=A0A0V0QBN5_PSEPJ|nr:Ankyrin repeat-containing domain [Pseudocohnilembus persalinus]|eukprot:KRW99660.1 Ankyrin repeat-containing domain [Pseudocohnilembus persalinus]